MDLMTVIGVILAFVALVLGSVLKGAGIKGLLGGAAFVIVIVGTAAAVMAQTPKSVIMRAIKMGKWLFKPPEINPDEAIANICLLYTSPSPRDVEESRMPSSA